MSNEAEIGINNPEVIDEVAYDPESKEIVLVMVESRPWDSPEVAVELLKDKIAKYISFALGEQLAEEFPDHQDKSIRFQLNCSHMPEEAILTFLSQVNDVLGKQNARLVVNTPPLEPTVS